MADGEAGRRARSGKPNEMLRRNIGHKERCADEKPANVAARQKIFLAGAPAPRKVKTNSKNDRKINTNDGEIEIGESFVHSCNLCCKEHSVLLGAS